MAKPSGQGSDLKADASRRVRKRERTRRQIQEIAVRLFFEKGFDNVTIVEIANEADVDVTTFWRHFGSKMAVLYADQEEWLAEFRNTLAECPPELSPLDCCIHALANAGAVTEPKLNELRANLLSGDPSPEVQAAVLCFEALVQREMALAVAARLDVDPDQDPRPFVLAGTVIAAGRWLMQKMLASGARPVAGRHEWLSIAAIIENSRLLMDEGGRSSVPPLAIKPAAAKPAAAPARRRRRAAE